MYKRYTMVLPLMLAFAVFIIGAAARGGFSGSGESRDAPVYTVMIYMNGSDLESEFGAATDDLVEMLDSGLDSRSANVLILTGGALRWQNDGIPETECVVWELADGELNELVSFGRANMGNPDTLRDFLKFCMAARPAEKYGLIMWDHGGGSIAGFGHDEKFCDASLTLADMKKAFGEAGLADNRLEFLGFDACLMATVEMAVLAADYARVMIAAEDLEPGEGWDYGFLAAFNEKPGICGFELGEIIVDTFFEFYEWLGVEDEEILTLSVIAPEKAGAVMDAMGRLMARGNEALRGNGTPFSGIAKRRARTKTFGEGSPRDNYADMVDIGDMAVQLADLYPREAEQVLRALAECVTYNRHNSDKPIYGLSTFYIYGGKTEGVPSLKTYSALEMDGEYTAFLHHFFDRLVRARSGENENLNSELVLWQPLENGSYRMAGLLNTPAQEELLWPGINGIPVAMFPCAATENARLYAIPAAVNGRDAEIIVSFSHKYPDGKILGIRHNSANVFQKGYAPISPGDEIAFYQLEYDFASQREAWRLADGFNVVSALTWVPAPEGFKTGYRHTDICGHISYTAPF